MDRWSIIAEPSLFHSETATLPRVVLVDPPEGDRHGPDVSSYFAFSDIVWHYAAGVHPVLGDRLCVVSGYPTGLPGAMCRLIRVPHSRWHLRNPASRRLLYLRYAAVIEAVGADIIHTPDYYALAAIVKQLPESVPIITTPGNILERQCTFNPYDRWYSRSLRWAIRVLRERDARVIATSEYMAGWWRDSGFPAHRVQVLPLPIAFSAGRLDPGHSKAKLGWWPEEINLLSVAAFRLEMQIPLLIRAFSAVASSPRLTRAMPAAWEEVPADAGKSLRLHLVGEGPERGEVERLVTRLGLSRQVVLHGDLPSSQLPLYYTAADALMVSRRFNATPRAAQEALSHGTPVIANVNPSLGDLPAPLQEGIVQVDLANSGPETLAEAIARALRLSSRRRALADAARDTFGVESIGMRLAQIYLQAAR